MKIMECVNKKKATKERQQNEGGQSRSDTTAAENSSHTCFNKCSLMIFYVFVTVWTYGVNPWLKPGIGQIQQSLDHVPTSGLFLSLRSQLQTTSDDQTKESTDVVLISVTHRPDPSNTTSLSSVSQKNFNILYQKSATFSVGRLKN